MAPHPATADTVSRQEYPHWLRLRPILFWGALVVIGFAIVMFVSYQLSVALTSYRPVINAAYVLAVAVVLSLFPLVLQRSFEHTKKARIRGDVWTDLVALGYWTKLSYSATVNHLMEGEHPVGMTSKLQWRWGSDRAKADEPPPAADETVAPDVRFALGEFSNRFEEHYGQSAFTLPLVLLVFLYLVGWLSVVSPGGGTLSESLAGGMTAYLINTARQLSMFSAAFLGAYFFSLQGLFHRYVRSDFKPMAINQASLRLISAWVVAMLLMLLFPRPAANAIRWDLVVGFFAGIFALDLVMMIWNYVQRREWLPWLSARRINFASFANADLTELDGFDSWHKDRMDEAGINYVRGLATVDFLDLLLAVRLPSETLVDWVDQAILRSHLTQDGWIELHKATALRTATDMLDMLAKADDGHKLAMARVLMNGNLAASDQRGSGGNDRALDGLFVINTLSVALSQDPNIAFICTYRKQQSKFVNHAKAFPANWPIPCDAPVPQPAA